MGLNLSLIKKLSYYFFKRYRGGGLDKGEYRHRNCWAFYCIVDLNSIKAFKDP